MSWNLPSYIALLRVGLCPQRDTKPLLAPEVLLQERLHVRHQPRAQCLQVPLGSPSLGTYREPLGDQMTLGRVSCIPQPMFDLYHGLRYRGCLNSTTASTVMVWRNPDHSHTPPVVGMAKTPL